MQPVDKVGNRYRIISGGDFEIRQLDGDIHVIPYAEFKEIAAGKRKKPDYIPFGDGSVNYAYHTLVHAGEENLPEKSIFMDRLHDSDRPAHIVCLALEAIWRMLDAKAVVYDKEAWDIVLQTGAQVFPQTMQSKFNWDMTKYENHVRSRLNEFEAELYELDSFEFPGMDFGKIPWHRMIWQVHALVRKDEPCFVLPPAPKFTFVTREFLETHHMIDRNPTTGVEHLAAVLSCTNGYQEYRIWDEREEAETKDYEPAFDNIACVINGVECDRQRWRTDHPTHFTLESLVERVANWNETIKAVFYDAEITIRYADGRVVERSIPNRWKLPRWDLEIVILPPDEEDPDIRRIMDIHKERFEYEDGMEMTVRFTEPKTAEGKQRIKEIIAEQKKWHEK